jgi:hypothetical protein
VVVDDDGQPVEPIRRFLTFSAVLMGTLLDIHQQWRIDLDASYATVRALVTAGLGL